MDEHDRLSLVQHLEDRRVVWIAKPTLAEIGHQADAVDFQRLEDVVDLGQAGVDLVDRQGREDAELAGMVAFDLRHEVVDLARDLRGLGGILGPDLRRIGHRQHGFADTGALHIVERLFERPVADRRRVGAVAAHVAEMARQHRMVMNIDPRQRLFRH